MIDLYELAVKKLGIDPILAWDYTPYEISLLAEQRNEQQDARLNEYLFLAWHTEAFARQKRLPRLEKVLRDVARARKFGVQNQADQYLIAMAKAKGVEIKQE